MSAPTHHFTAHPLADDECVLCLADRTEHPTPPRPRGRYLPAIASQWDRTCLDPGSRPTVPPCERCAPERYATADREAELRRYIGEIEYELATANRELARLRRTYEPTTEGEM